LTISFFDEGDETATQPAARPQRPRAAGATAPRPRRPQGAGRPGGIDQHTVMVRRRVFAVVAVVLLIIIVLVINGCLKSAKTQSLKDYNHNVSQISTEWDSQVAKPLFTALSGASGKSALDVEVQVDQLRIQAQNIASSIKKLSVPGDMTGAQRALLMAANLRVEALTKIAALLPAALGGSGQQAITNIAGDMEIFLASDVLHSQRVVPLIQESLSSNGVHGLSTTQSRFLPNLGWLDPNTVASRLTGKTAGSTSATSGTHGSSLLGVSVGATALEPEPTINHISGGGSPTFTVNVENTGSAAESNVKVDITVTAGGKQYKASHVVNQTQPGNKVSVEIPVSGIPTGVAAKVEVIVQPVAGETNTENNKATYLAIFSP
jgi:hypothetical protein